MLKKFVLAWIAAVFSVVSYADELLDFKAVKEAIMKGSSIHLTVDFLQCAPSRALYAYYSPKAIMISKGLIFFSDYHFTLNNPQFPNQATVENISYKFNQNGTLTIKSVILDPVTFKEKGKQPPLMTCDINKGAHFFSNN